MLCYVMLCLVKQCQGGPRTSKAGQTQTVNMTAIIATSKVCPI